AYAPFLDTPSVVVAHSDVLSWFSEGRGLEAPAEWDGYAQVVERGLESAAAVVAPSSYQAELIERHYGRPVDGVIWNGVELAPRKRRRVAAAATPLPM